MQETSIKSQDKLITDLILNSQTNCIKTMNEVLTSLDPQNAPFYLAFVISFLSKQIQIPDEDFLKLKEILTQIIQKFQILLPSSFKHLIPKPEISIKKESTHKNSKPIMQEFRQIILESLIKNSKYEIWNALNIFFKNKGYREYLIEEDLCKLFIGSLEHCDEIEKVKIIKEIAFLIEPKNVLKVLQYFEEKPKFIEEFLLLLKFTNPPSYEFLLNSIYSEKKFFKETIIPNLPDFEFEKVVGFIKDYNWNVTSAIIERRPEVARKFIEAFHNDELGMARTFFLEALAEKDVIFSFYFEDLKLNGDEIIELSTRSLNFAKKYFKTIQNEDQMIQFCKNFTKKFENFLFDFIKETENSPTFELFLKCILKTFRLTGEIKTYVLEKYSSDQRFFHGLIPYISNEDIEKLLEKFYQKDLSIECLLRKSNPQELIIDIHKFENPKLSAKLIQECIKNNKFEDNDWVLAMKSLEKVDSPIKMFTCKQIILEKPRLKGQVIMFIKRSMGESIWMFKKNTEDLLSCIELLGDEAISIYESMTRDEIIFVLRKSRVIENNLRKYLSKFSYHNYSANMRFLDECLRSI